MRVVSQAIEAPKTQAALRREEEARQKAQESEVEAKAERAQAAAADAALRWMASMQLTKNAGRSMDKAAHRQRMMSIEDQ